MAKADTVDMLRPSSDGEPPQSLKTFSLLERKKNRKKKKKPRKIKGFNFLTYANQKRVIIH